MALQGDLETLGVVELLGWLAARRASGQLSLGHGMIARRFHLRQGQVVLASSSEGRALLGQRLLARGLLAKHQLAEMLSNRDEGARLGQALHASGYVAPAALRQVLADKTEELLADTLSWTEGRFFFDDAALPEEGEGLDAAVDLARFLTEATPVAVTEADVLDVQPLRKRVSSGSADAPGPGPGSPTEGARPGVRRGRPNRAA